MVDQESPRQERNWFGDITLNPARVVRPERIEDVVRVVRDPERYPSPVRAAGSSHSITRCLVAEGGTLLDMRGMTGILEIGPDTVTAEAGALYVDVAEALRERGLEFYVNLEIGTLTMGAASCTHTKDSSFPGENGPLSASCVGMKLVTPAGDVIEVTEEEDPERLRALRTSYGLLGIICEVTFRVRPIRPLAFQHETLTLEEFLDRLPALRSRDEALMYYVFPFHDRITIERRWYRDSGAARSTLGWKVRNLAQATVGPSLARAVRRFVPGRTLRNGLLRLNLTVFRALLGRLRSHRSTAADQIIRYDDVGGWSAFTFSIWTFPEARFPTVLREYVAFCKEHDTRHQYRCDISTVGYRIDRDPSSLLSYAPDGPVMTLDPVSTGGPGWARFLDSFNEFAAHHRGTPLLNQTPQLRAGQVRQAFGSRLDELSRIRRETDPEDRLLNQYFATILDEAAA